LQIPAEQEQSSAFAAPSKYPLKKAAPAMNSRFELGAEARGNAMQRLAQEVPKAETMKQVIERTS
jgi:hypothetical protein